MRLKIRPEVYSLELTFYPSFLSSLYERRGEWLVKVAGVYRRLALRQLPGGALEVEVPHGLSIPEDDLLEQTGLWHKPFEYKLRLLDEPLRGYAEAVAEALSGLRIPISPRDLQQISIAALLSKRTDYHKFTLRWCKRIWSEIGESWHLIVSSSMLSNVGSSYQIGEMRKSLSCLLKLKPTLESLAAERASLSMRRLLMSCWGVGPKTADAIVMCTTGSTSLYPCDINLIRVLRRVGVLSSLHSPPEKAYCMRYVCQSCPRESCVIKVLNARELGGWIQSLTYVVGKVYCRPVKPRCSDCPARAVCSSFSELSRWHS